MLSNILTSWLFVAVNGTNNVPKQTYFPDIINENNVNGHQQREATVKAHWATTLGIPISQFYIVFRSFPSLPPAISTPTEECDRQFPFEKNKNKNAITVIRESFCFWHNCILQVEHWVFDIRIVCVEPRSTLCTRAMQILPIYDILGVQFSKITFSLSEKVYTSRLCYWPKCLTCSSSDFAYLVIWTRKSKVGLLLPLLPLTAVEGNYSTRTWSSTYTPLHTHTPTHTTYGYAGMWTSVPVAAILSKQTWNLCEMASYGNVYIWNEFANSDSCLRFLSVNESASVSTGRADIQTDRQGDRQTGSEREVDRGRQVFIWLCCRCFVSSI